MYQQSFPDQSEQRLRHESIEILAKKISNHIKRLIATGKSYTTDELGTTYYLTDTQSVYFI